MENFYETMKNPFMIDIPDKEVYDKDDLLLIQNKLTEKITDIEIFLKSIYPKTNFRTSLDIISKRCTNGLRQKIFDISNNVMPAEILLKIGDGGNGKNCIVCTTPLCNDRYLASQTIAKSLESVGYNGYFYLCNGGFPNPTGTEMKYAGVPYSFKIFLMLEAKKKGFEKVIWIDAACQAINNPQRLFDILNYDDAIFRAFPANCFESKGSFSYDNVCFPGTIELLNNLTNRDIRYDNNVNSIVFGLNMISPTIEKFIEEYYHMVKLGLPFLSYFPEEIVIASIFNKPEYKHLFYNRYDSFFLYIHSSTINISGAKQRGYYFSQRSYPAS